MTLPLPSTLTPSKIGKFMTCPLAFRFAYIDRLPEPPSTYQVKGTLVHRVMQLLFSECHAASRTLEQAEQALEQAWQELEPTDLAELDLPEPAAASFRREARGIVGRYFSLEDPTAVRPIGLELDLRARLGALELHGILDRLDRLPSGDWIVVDYKTGRAPRPEQSRSRMLGVHFYALLCEQLLGRRPVEVRLMYLRDQVVVSEATSEQTMRGVRQRALAVWDAIVRGCEREDFRPNPSPLCNSCAFQDRCPEFQRGPRLGARGSAPAGREAELPGLAAAVGS